MRILIALMLAAAGFDVPGADDAAARGQAIAEAAHQKNEGFGDLQAVAEMHIRNGRGSEAVRALKIRILDLPGKSSRGLTVVSAPKDVKGTALLTHTDEKGENEQWLYLPGLARVKRIAASGKSGPFMGSEFSFEDFSAQLPDKYFFKLLREEKLNNKDCYVLERRPRDAQSSSYAYQHVWLDTEELRLQKVDFYDQQNTLAKTLSVSGYQLYKNKYWRASTLLMRNARTGAETELDWKDLQFGAGLTERDFDVNSLAASH